MRPELEDFCRFSSHWATSHEAEPPGWAYFHIVTKGSCILERRDERRLRLDAGDLLLLSHGDAHILRSRDARGGSYGPPVTVAYNSAIRIKTNTNQPATELICGRLRFEAAPDNLAIAALPDTIVLKLGGKGVLQQMRSPVLAIRDELDGGAKLAQVASEVGYRSESAFSRAFVRRFGITPREARNIDQA